MANKVTPIGDVIKNVFAGLEGKKTFTREEIESYWKALVGAGGFKHSRPVSLKRKILTVRVDSSGWLQELSMQERKILKGLKRALGKDKISGIHFRIGELDA